MQLLNVLVTRPLVPQLRHIDRFFRGLHQALKGHFRLRGTRHPLVVHGEALHQVLAQSRRGALAELRAALGACLEANVALVSSGLDARTVLTEIVVKIAAPKA